MSKKYSRSIKGSFEISDHQRTRVNCDKPPKCLGIQPENKATRDKNPQKLADNSKYLNLDKAKLRSETQINRRVKRVKHNGDPTNHAPPGNRQQTNVENKTKLMYTKRGNTNAESTLTKVRRKLPEDKIAEDKALNREEVEKNNHRLLSRMVSIFYYTQRFNRLLDTEDLNHLRVNKLETKVTLRKLRINVVLIELPKSYINSKLQKIAKKSKYPNLKSVKLRINTPETKMAKRIKRDEDATKKIRSEYTALLSGFTQKEILDDTSLLFTGMHMLEAGEKTAFPTRKGGLIVIFDKKRTKRQASD
jgi:hypothetical protein